MTTEARRIKKIRSGHRGFITKTLHDLHGLLKSEIDPPIRKQLTLIDTTLEAKLRLLRELDEKYLAVCEEGEIENDVEESEDLALRIELTRQEIALQLEEGTPVKTTPNSVGTTENSTTTLPAPQHPSLPSPSPLTLVGTRTKLPRITLPIFKGDVKQFKTFLDSFESSVNSRTDLNKIDKFSYLISLLEGNALRAIDGLPLTEANYDAAIDILVKRFGKPQQLINAHMDELLKIPNCESDFRPGQLRYIYDKLNINIRALESLGVSSNQYGSLLIPIVMAKLPPEIRIQITRDTNQDVWEFEPILQIIDREINARELSDRMKLATGNRMQQAQNPPRNDRNHKFSGGTTRSLLNDSDVKSNYTKTTPSCVYCSNKHFSASCSAVTSIEERREILRRDKRCYICLKRGHRQFECDRNCRKCGKKHHQSICTDDRQARQAVNQESTSRELQVVNNGERTNQEQEVKREITTASVSVQSPKTVLLQTATATASSENGDSVRVRILFDNGSQRSYVTSELSSKLNLNPKQKELLTLNTFGDNRSKKRNCDLVDLFITKSGDAESTKVSALTFPVICSPLHATVNTNDLPFIEDLDLADDFDSSDADGAIDVLIGSDHYWDFVTGEVKRSPDGIIAANSRLGWLLSGPIHKSRISGNYLTHANLILEGFDSANDDLKNVLKSFWNVESLGVESEESVERGSDFNDNIKFEDGRYHVKLPWKDDNLRPSSNNYSLCENRLKGLYRKLKSNDELLIEYDNTIKQQLESGVIEKSKNVTENKKDNLHYLAHHPVIKRERETSKCRIVYDGSAKSTINDRSINDCLQTGPNLIPHTFDILTRFRLNSVGLTSDIEKAFLMVGIQEEDRNYLRFLWFDDVFLCQPKIIEYNFTRLVFGLRPSPAILGTTILHHLKSYTQSEPEIAQLLSKALYVDDFITGGETEERVIEIYNKSKRIMSEGGFNLRKWRSNSIAVQSLMNAQENPAKMAPPATDQHVCSTTTESDYTSVLGMKWNTASDKLSYDFRDVCLYADSLPLSKRSVLRVTAKLFDPLGLLSPFTVKLKVLFQELCVDHVNWDEEMQGELLKRWKSFLCELKHLSENQIFSGKPIEVKLHGFSDASQKAYAAVVYLRNVYSNGSIEVRLVTSKNRVAPMKKQSIPRLELLGALLLARLIHHLHSVLGIDFSDLWTDSMTTLCWIQNPRVWKQYVNARVEEIHNLTDPNLWRHCPGEMNPADLPSRGLSAKALSGSSTWWNGPEFLYLPENEWPTRQKPSGLPTNDEDVMKEATKVESTRIHTLNITDNKATDIGIDRIININNYSDLSRLLRVTAYVIKYVHILRAKINKEETQPTVVTGGVLNASDLKYSENVWIRKVQASSFKGELSFLSNDETSSPLRVQQFGLYLDSEKIIRCKGRVNSSSLEHNSRRPILLPADHYFVKLLVTREHKRIKHSGIRDTLTTIRENYWILRGRSIVKRVLRQCVVCRRHNRISYSPAPTTDLPESRVSDEPPFSRIGIDYASPFYVKNDSKGEDKVYVLLITCGSTRAIHLELTRNLSAAEFLLAFRRFAARRGLPATIQSDNAKTFESVSKEIKAIVRSPEVWNYLVDNQIEWDFIVERAPWWGGYWERLVKSVKFPLKKVIGRSSLKYDELNTLLVEVEGLVNSRPLTYVYSDDNSISYPLTPSDLIYGRRITTTPNGSHYEINSTCASLTKRVKHHRKLLCQFTRRWRREYLTSLREHAVKLQRGGSSQIKLGDIVILKDDSTNQCFWKLAKVDELIEGRDGNVRAAKVKVSRGINLDSSQILRRPIQHLIPLEVSG